MKAKHRSLLAGHFFLIVRVDKKRHRRTRRADRGLYHIWNEALVGGLVVVLELLARVFGMTLQIEVGAIVDALDLSPPEREFVLDVRCSAGIVRKLLVWFRADLRHRHAAIAKPVEAHLHPVVVPRRVLARTDKELHLHLLELASAEQKVLRVDLVAE